MSTTEGKIPNPNRCEAALTEAVRESLAVIASDKHSIHDLSGMGICGVTGDVTEVWDIQHLLVQRWKAIRETGRPPEKYDALRFHILNAPVAEAEMHNIESIVKAA